MAEDRLTLLCGQSPKELTGIDFIHVDPSDQTQLRVYFLIDPTELGVPWATAPTPDEIHIWAPGGGRSVAEVEVSATAFVDDLDLGRRYLAITTAEPGDFSIYKLHIESERLDYYFNDVEFNFKQGCPSRLDCKQSPPDQSCPEGDDGIEFNPLARDFVSLRRALLDYAAQKYPDWTYRSEADVGVMLLELMAAIGDEFNYIKDRFIREGVLEELSQRRSLRQLVRLLDYEIHDGLSPSTVLELEVAAEKGEVQVAAGTVVWAHRLGESPIPFELGEGLADVHTAPSGDPKQFTVHENWNTLSVHEPDGAQPKLAKGATQLYLEGDQTALEHRMIVLHEDPSDGSEPRRHLVTVTGVDLIEDGLAGFSVTRIEWSAEQALPCPMVIADMSAKGNVVPATAGETFVEWFTIRGDGSGLEAIERDGPLNALEGTRAPVFRYSPRHCEGLGLGWLGELTASVPQIELQEVDAVDSLNWDEKRLWTWRRTLLDSIADDEHFTLEDGTWRRIIGYRRPTSDDIVHRDWAANAGYTIRFGDGEFGLTPADGTVFRVTYRSGPGSAANVAAGTIVHLWNPVDGEAPFNPDLVAVSNPFDVTSGVDPEDMQRAKFLAPEAFRYDALNAVTAKDYKRLAETLGWVQQANATFRWTGSWLTVFVAADPRGAFAMSAQQFAELEDLMDCVRQVGRDVYVLEPDYIDLDLRVELCLRPGYYAGQVEAAVVAALTGPGGFFGPDEFTFGTPLRRSALEAAIQSVPGVRAVERIWLRAREKTGEIEFTEGVFEVGSGQILRVVNDRRVPEQGTVVVRARAVV
ncbi:MAG: baseplate J/gp47 family protein [Enhygromyxa sp.]